ncbi:MAG TPA: DUF3604 domain-containing protein [Chloroflexota bacterium]|nr:DUF3604 domain-containing protein [Chloroflexota bacterium]
MTESGGRGVGDAERLLPSPVWPPVAPPVDGRYGRATLAPVQPVIAGAFGTWTVTYTAGRYGIDDGGALRIAFHQTSDVGAPQFQDPAAADFCSVAWSTPAPCRLEARYDGELGVRPWKRTLVLRVRDQALRPGDTITITLGDRSGGSPGAMGQTFAGPMQFHVLVDSYATGIFLPIGEPLAVLVVAGAVDHLRVIAPSGATAGNAFAVTVVGLDHWGNVTAHRRETHRLDVPGTGTVRVEDGESGLWGESNPIRVRPAESDRAKGRAGRARRAGEGDASPAYRVFWGDLHAQSEETVGSGTLDEYFSHARDCAAVDFVGHQGNDFQVTREVWARIMAKTQEYDAANDFITFAGYEWSGNTPGGGDHNVHFKGGPGQRYDLNRSGHWQIYDRSDEGTDRFPVTELYREFAGRDDVILIPHVGGRYANLREHFDESLMPLVEICACWGVFEWFADDAFQRGVTFGFSAGSDDHTARPGMSHAPRGHFAMGGGLTAVLSVEKSRAAIWEALRARRTYATTGARILMEVTALTRAGSAQMGSVVALAADDALHLDVVVHGTAPLWRAEVLRWPDVVYRHPLPPPQLPPGRHRVRIGWTGSRIRARHRMTRWDGSLAIDGGRIVDAAGWGFDHPENGISGWSAREVRWTSETAGDWDGIVVQLECPADAALVFSTGPATARFTPRDLERGPLVTEAGGVGQRVEIERDPGPDQPRAVAFSYSAACPPPGQRQAYVVRITQQDGHISWSSPVFVERGS